MKILFRLKLRSYLCLVRIKAAVVLEVSPELSPYLKCSRFYVRLLKDKRCFNIYLFFRSLVLVKKSDDIFFLVSFVTFWTAIRDCEIVLDTAFSKYVTANRDARLLMVVIVFSEANNTCRCRVRSRTFSNFISDN